MPSRSSFRSPSALPGRQAMRRRTDALSRRLTTSRVLRQELISLAGLVGATVCNQAGQDVGRLVDLVARVYGGEQYPPVSGLVMRVGGRRSFLDAAAVSR